MNKLLVIMSILSLFYGVSSLSYAEEVKGLEDMIRDGDEFKVTPSKLNLDLNYFDDFSNYSNSRRDRFVRLDPENERKVFQMLENKNHFAEIVTDYAASAFFAETIRKEIETDQNVSHLEAGFYIGTAAGMACETGVIPIFQFRNKKMSRVICAIGAATLAGIGKEVYDSFYPESHTVDVNDAIATSLGGIAHIQIIRLKW